LHSIQLPFVRFIKMGRLETRIATGEPDPNPRLACSLGDWEHLILFVERRLSEPRDWLQSWG